MNVKKVVLVILVFVFCTASLQFAAASVYDDAIDMVCSLGIMFSPCLKKQSITGFNVRDFDSNAELNHAPFRV